MFEVDDIIALGLKSLVVQRDEETINRNLLWRYILVMSLAMTNAVFICKTSGQDTDTHSKDFDSRCSLLAC